MDILIWIVVAIVASLIVYRGSDLLESSAEHLSGYYGLPPVVHGTMVVAIGSSFPELSSTVLATLVHGEFELGLSVVVGSAIFNILVIPGLAGVMSPGGIKSTKELIYRDAHFYMIAVAGFAFVFALALIYNPAVIEGAAETSGSLIGVMTRPYMLIPIGLYALYVFIQQQEVSDSEAQERPEGINVTTEWGRLVLSLVLVVAGVEGLVRAALFFGEETGIPPFVWGITVIAGVTSVPDALISIRLAKRGEGVVSMGNVFGSNIFDLLIAVPAGVLIAGSIEFDFGISAPLFGFLAIATLILYVQLRTGLTLTRVESMILLVTYGVFIAWMVLEQADVMSLLPEAAETE